MQHNTQPLGVAPIGNVAGRRRGPSSFRPSPSSADLSRRTSRDDPNLHQLEDASLLDRIARGDRSAFWAFWCRYHSDLFWTYHRLCKGNRQEIHDCLSGLCISLSEALPIYARSIVKCRTWLRRTAVNHFIDTHRAHQRHPILVGSLTEVACIADGSGAQEIADPERTNSDRALLLKVLDSLNGIRDIRMRRAAHMRFIEEQPYTAIAEALGVSEELARKWIQQVRAHLRQTVPDHRETLPPSPSKKAAKPRRGKPGGPKSTR